MVLNKIKKVFAPIEPQDGEKRELWPSRAAFLLASIGSSVGLGNLWRFPAIAFKFGGGAFFVPYLLALFLIGIPILALELSLGKLFRSGDFVCFSRVNHRLRGLGLASIFGGYIVSSYYMVIMAWVLVYFFRSFQSVLPWTVKDPNDYFNEDILALPTDGNKTDPTVLIGPSFGTLILTWVMVYFCLWKGVTLTGKIVYVSMTLPLILIIVLFFRGITLPGSEAGILDYIGQFDSSKLSDPLIWSEAVGQIFFSIGIAFGTMTCYASYNSKYQNTTVDSLIIALSNSIYEIFCGFVVFAVIGYLRQETGNMDVAVGSFGLVFSSFSVAFSTLPAPQFWSVFFYLTLFTLGIDSAFSLVEAGVTVLMDSRTYNSYPRELVVGTVCLSCFLISTLYVSDVGVYYLDAVDYMINNIGLVLIGLLECVGAGFLYKFNDVCRVIGLRSKLLFDGFYFGGLIVGSIVGYHVGPVPGVCVTIGMWIFGFIFGVLTCKDRSLENMGQQIWWMTLGGIENLRSDINDTETKGKTRVPFFWSLTIKYIAVPALFMVLTIPFRQISVGDPKVPIPNRWLGLLITGIAIAMLAVGFIAPRWLVFLLPPEEDIDEAKRFNEISFCHGDLEVAETKENLAESISLDEVSKDETAGEIDGSVKLEDMIEGSIKNE